MKTKTVIVTGASSGLGASIATQLAQMGANVVISARTASALEQTAQRVQQAGTQARVVPGNITDIETMQNIVKTAVDEFGSICALVNNAGTLDPIAMSKDADIDAWKHTFDVNFFAPLQLTREALPYLRDCEGRGRIINISSGAAVRGYPTWGAYGASKSALNHFTQTLSAEEPEVISIAMRPGVVDTPMQRQIREQGKNTMPSQLYERFESLHTTGKLLDPDLPGFSAAVLALQAPPDWSGEFMDWDNEHVRRLRERCERMLNENQVPGHLVGDEFPN